MKTYAIIPCYNEEKTIGKIIEGVKKQGAVPLVINDGSTDNTFEEARKHEGAIIIDKPFNSGKGYSLSSAQNYLRKKHFDVVAIIDGDGQYDPKYIGHIMSTYRCVKCARVKMEMFAGVRDLDKIPFSNSIANKLISYIFRTLYDIPHCLNYSDITCGFIAMDKKTFLSTKFTGGYVTDVDIRIQFAKKHIYPTVFIVDVKYKEQRDVISGVRMVFGIIIWMMKRRFE